MFNLNFYKKKFRKILLSINKILESFFIELGRSKHPTDKSTTFKKKIIHLDHRIESFFDKFKNFKKFNQGKKNFYLINTKPGAFITLIVILILRILVLNMKPQINEQLRISIFKLKVVL